MSRPRPMRTRVRTRLWPSTGAATTSRPDVHDGICWETMPPSESGWTWVLTNPAERDLRRIRAEDRRRMLDALDRLAEDPRSGDIRKLAGRTGEWRLRVGELRVRF